MSLIDENWIDIGESLPTDLPVVSGIDYTGNSQPTLSQGTNFGDVLSGILTPVVATANTALGLWGTYNKIEDSLATAKFNRVLANSKQELEQNKSLGSLELQKLQTANALKIEQARATLSTANDMARINSSGGNVGGGTPLLLYGLFGLGLWLVTRGTK